MTASHLAIWSDAEMLALLRGVERDGLSCTVMAQRLGRSRSACLGMMKRIRDDLAAVPDLALCPENQDGGMPEGWERRRG